MKNLFTLLFSLALTAGIFLQNAHAQTIKTVGATGDYATLKAAFDAINAGTLTGGVTGEITLQIVNNTTETASAVLNASGGTASYSSVEIYPTLTGLSISGSLAAPLIDLNGADNVTVDGRVNELGATDLVISNTSVVNTANTSTIRFINDASNNTVQYCTIKGSSTANSSLAAGIILFSTTTGTTGNDNNTITNNNITNAGGNRPTNVVYSMGTTLKENSGNTFTSNNIFDFLNKGTASNGIQLANFTSSSSITANSFYETSSFVPAASVAYNVIQIGAQTTNTVVSNNYIGGNAAGGIGTWDKTSGLTPLYTNTFTAIYVTTATSCSVQGNTISNFTYADAGASSWTGIFSGSSSTSIGTTAGNNINTITLTGGATNSNFYGINISGTGNVSAENNIIGSITVSAAAAIAANFTGILNNGSGSNSINNNTIGDLNTANSINASSASTGNAQTVYGISSAGGFATISSNTIANLTNGTTNSSPATAGLINGILIAGGSNIVSYNTIQDLTIANTNNLTTHQASVGGIVLNYTTAAAQNIIGNTIFNLSNSNASFDGCINGIYFNGSATVNKVTGNFIHSLSAGASNTANLYGIKINAGTTTYANNIINLGDNSTATVYGIAEAGGSSNLYFNTIYVGGAPTTGILPSYALFSSTTNTRNFRNNILSNARSNSGATGKHYAISLASISGLTIDYNDYFTSGTDGVLGFLGAAEVTTLVDWQTATVQDAASLNTNPLFALAGGFLPANYLPAASLTGSGGTGVLVDFNESARTLNKMGALESASAVTTVDVYNGATLLGSYPNIGKAFNAIKNGTHTGALIVKINASQNLTIPAVLNASGTGAANYTSLLIYPTVSGLTITGDLAMPLIDIDGADNITFDGRVGATGTTKDLVINNTSISTSSNTSTIRFINDASNNTIQYCIIKGAETQVLSGVIFFSTTNGNNGNDNNLIENNDITSSSDATRPVDAIYSGGQTTAGLENSGNIIRGNNFYNFLSKTIASFGVFIFTGNNDWTITGNSFYETTSFAPTGSVEYNIISIKIAGTFNVSGNFIGGSAPGCIGLWTKTNSANNLFYGITYSPSTTTTPSFSIQGNTIQNFSWSNSLNANWTGIYILNGSGGTVNIGSSTSNTIGAATGNNSITLINGTTGGAFYGIYQNASVSPSYYFDLVNISNNVIGAITVANTSATNATNFFGIYRTCSLTSTRVETYNILNNTIGSVDDGSLNSINVTSASTTAVQTVYGICTYGRANQIININGNIISKLTNATNNTTVGTTGLVHGISQASASLAKYTINNNTVRDLSISNSNNTFQLGSSIVGILLSSATAIAQTITGNTIYNLSNTSAASGSSMFGIYFSGGTTASSISGNFIHTYSSNPTNTLIPAFYGIRSVGGVATFSNNIVALGSDLVSVIYGLYTTSGTSAHNIYFNTIHIGGTAPSGTGSSYAFFSTGTGARNIRNNIFNNARSTVGAVSGHIAASIITGGTLTCNYNDYVASGTGGVTTGLPIVVVGQDANSVSINPVFANPGGTAALDYLPSATTLIGVTGTSILTDYAGVTRATVPTMGAFEKSLELAWDGSFDTDWNTAANWTPETIPVATAKVTIPDVANDPIINQAIATPASCLDLTIANGAVVTINAAKALTVNGTLTNNSGATGLIIKTGGSLIESTAGVAATMERDIAANEWHLISSPVSDAQSGIFTGKYLQYHTESSNSYTDVVSTTDPLTPMRGYALWGGDAGFTASYAGTLNAGSKTFSVTNSGAGLGWNLVGNPYPCSIDWSAASGWTKTNVNNSTYIHVNSSTWATYVSGVGTNGGSRYIAPGQGYFVAATAAGTLATTDAVKVHNAATFFKNSEATVDNLIRLAVAGNGYTDEAVVRISPEATTGFDSDYDAYKLYGDVAEAAQLYSIGDTRLSINTLPETNSVPVGIHAGISGTYTIAAPEINNFAEVSLEDTKTGIFTDLTKGSYTFSFASGENEERFVLHFSTVGFEDPESENTTVYAVNKTLYVDLPDAEGDIFIFNLAGQLVKSAQASKGLNAVNLSNASGIYMVKVVTKKSTIIRKIWLGQ